MPPRSRGLSQGRTIQTVRRKTAWQDGTGGTGAATFSSTTPAFLGSAVSPTVDGLTVIRQRGWLSGHLTVGSVNGNLLGAFGIGFATQAAVTAGAGSVPTPLTEQSADSWLYWVPIQLSTPIAIVADTAPAGEILSANFSIEVDTKAMRKFPQESSLYAMAEFAESGVMTAELFWDSRLLVKLP